MPPRHQPDNRCVTTSTVAGSTRTSLAPGPPGSAQGVVVPLGAVGASCCIPPCSPLPCSIPPSCHASSRSSRSSSDSPQAWRAAEQRDRSRRPRSRPPSRLAGRHSSPRPSLRDRRDRSCASASSARSRPWASRRTRRLVPRPTLPRAVGDAEQCSHQRSCGHTAILPSVCIGSISVRSAPSAAPRARTTWSSRRAATPRAPCLQPAGQPRARLDASGLRNHWNRATDTFPLARTEGVRSRDFHEARALL
jgi:hypothetical protein